MPDWLLFPSIAEIPAGLWRWPHFSPAELRCKGTGRLLVVPTFLDRLEKMRRMYDRPLIVNSGYRAPEYNAQVSDSGLAGPHTRGRAIDLRIYGTHAHELVGLALAMGFTGFGVQQKGPQASRFIHLDDLTAADGFPRPWIWSY